MRQFLGITLGMIGALVLWQSIAAFYGAAIVINGLHAGLSLLGFSITLFIAGSVVVKPKKDEINE